MLQRIPDVPDGIDALAAIGTLTRQDYEQSIEPILDEARRSSRRIRLLVQLGPEYDGYTAGAAWEKTANAFRSPSLLRLLDGYAVVTDLHWLHEWTHVMGFLLPFPLRVFGNDERDEAIAWLSALPEGPGVSHYLVSESGVLVVEVTAPLRAQDFAPWPPPRMPGWKRTTRCRASSSTPVNSPGGRTPRACCATSASCATTTVRYAGWRWRRTASRPT